MPRRPLILTFALVCAALLLQGCGGDKSPDPAPAAQATSTPAPDPGAIAAVDGGLGGAITASAGEGEESLAGAGDLPDEVLEDPSDATGVAGARRCANSDLIPTARNLRRVARATFCLMNAERRRRGLPALKRDRRLARASVRHSRDMVRKRYFAHSSPSGGRLRDRLRAARYIPRRGRWTVGENLAWGSGAVAAPRAIVRAWMGSPGHRENLLAVKYSSVGVGIVFGTPKGRGGGAMFTTDFGRLG